MHGINWNNENLDYFELASIIHQHCSPITEYFAKRLEIFKNLSPYLCKDLKNLDDLGFKKASILLENNDAEWNCSNYRYPHKTLFSVPSFRAFAVRLKEGFCLRNVKFESFWCYLICSSDCSLLFLFVIFFSEIRVVLENELVRKIFKTLVFHTLLLLHSLAPFLIILFSILMLFLSDSFDGTFFGRVLRLVQLNFC